MLESLAALIRRVDALLRGLLGLLDDDEAEEEEDMFRPGFGLLSMDESSRNRPVTYGSNIIITLSKVKNIIWDEERERERERE